MGLQIIYVFAKCYGNYTNHEFTAAVLSYLTQILWAKGHPKSASSLDLLSLSHLPWDGLNWLFTTSMSSSSSTETSISSSLNIQWKDTIHNHSTGCFASETLLSDQSVNNPTSQGWNCAINSSQSPGHFLTKIEQFSAPKSRLNFCFGDLKRLQSFYLHIGG